MGYVREIVTPKVVAEGETEYLLLIVEVIECAVVGDTVDDGVGMDEVEDLSCLPAAVGECEDIAVVIDKAEPSLVLAGGDDGVGRRAREMAGAPATRRGR